MESCPRNLLTTKTVAFYWSLTLIFMLNSDTVLSAMGCVGDSPSLLSCIEGLDSRPLRVQPFSRGSPDWTAGSTIFEIRMGLRACQVLRFPGPHFLR